MDSNNGRQNEGDRKGKSKSETAERLFSKLNESADWKRKLKPGKHEEVVNRMMDKLKEYFPILSGQEESDGFRKVVQKVEDGIFTISTSKAEYIMRICLKTRAMSKCQNINHYIKVGQLMKSNRFI